GFDLSEIKATAMTVYLVMPANRIGPNARFLRLFISSVIAAITSSNVQPAHRVAFLLDEFGQLGYMKQIEDAVSLLRGYGLAFWVFIQDLSQLQRPYPKWQTFLANSAKSFYGTDDYDTAK
ncbi:type IV secretory system conjugative DNA transfer family protein, partial [Burkholderia cenocepacia]